MLYAKVEGNERATATPKATAICPCCDAQVKAKCGSIVSWHWSHISKQDCDSFSEPMTLWHLDWQRQFSEEAREVTMVDKDGTRHRADVFLQESNTVIELQHSSISAAEVQQREQFYGSIGTLVWVVDISGWADTKVYSGTIEVRNRPAFAGCKLIVFNLGGLLLLITDEISSKRGKQEYYYKPLDKVAFVDNPLQEIAAAQEIVAEEDKRKLALEESRRLWREQEDREWREAYQRETERRQELERMRTRANALSKELELSLWKQALQEVLGETYEDADKVLVHGRYFCHEREYYKEGALSAVNARNPNTRHELQTAKYSGNDKCFEGYHHVFTQVLSVIGVSLEPWFTLKQLDKTLMTTRDKAYVFYEGKLQKKIDCSLYDALVRAVVAYTPQWLNLKSASCDGDYNRLKELLSFYPETVAQPL